MGITARSRAETALMIEDTYSLATSLHAWQTEKEVPELSVSRVVPLKEGPSSLRGITKGCQNRNSRDE